MTEARRTKATINLLANFFYYKGSIHKSNCAKKPLSKLLKELIQIGQRLVSKYKQDGKYRFNPRNSYLRQTIMN